MMGAIDRNSLSEQSLESSQGHVGPGGELPGWRRAGAKTEAGVSSAGGWSVKSCGRAFRTDLIGC